MKAERVIFENNDRLRDAASDARSELDITAGRVVDHTKVAAWLEKWGSPDETPAPPEWLA